MGFLRAVEVRVPGASRLVRGVARYVFPDHWTFLFGEIALYCFVVLVVTGVYLSFWFDPSLATTTYHGAYAPLAGTRMSAAYRSTVDMSLGTRAGLLVRQTHHWAALVFIVAIVLHLMRVFFTGAFRKPRDLNWYIGLTMLTLALLEGFIGYTLPDDLLSGMGMAIAYSVALSIPWAGAHLALWLWDGAFPGSGAIEARLYIAHVLLLPVLIAVLISVHLFFVALLKHTVFPGPGRTEENVVGTRLWPAYALRSIGLFCAVVGVLVAARRAGADQPGLAVRALRDVARDERRPARLVSRLADRRAASDASFDVVIAGRTVIPNPFFGGVLFPFAIFGLLYAWPVLERRRHGGRRGAPPARPAAGRTGSHRGGGGRLRLRLHHLRGRVGGQDLRRGRYPLRASDLALPHRRDRRARRRVPHHEVGRARACETPAGIRSAAPTIAPSVAPAAAASSDRLTIAAVSRSSENRHLGTTG